MNRGERAVAIVRSNLRRVQAELEQIEERMVKEVMPDTRVEALFEAAMSLALAADTLKGE